jgi:hypothetical protein
VEELLWSPIECTLTEKRIGRLIYANGRSGGTVVTITLLFTFIMILFTVRLSIHLEQTKSVWPLSICVQENRIMLETVIEANKITNKFRGEREVYNVICLYFYKKHIGATISTRCGSSVENGMRSRTNYT